MSTQKLHTSTTRGVGVAALAALCLTLVACGEAPQTMGRRSAAAQDAAAATGTVTTVFKQGNWAAGDANAWAQQIRTRAQYGMNEYQRTTN